MSDIFNTVWTPRDGGMASDRVLYPGFAPTPVFLSVLAPASVLWRRLGAGDLVKITVDGAGESGLQLTAIDDSNGPGLSSLGLKPTQSAHGQATTGAGDALARTFVAQDVIARLKARGLTLDALEFAELFADDHERERELLLRADEAVTLLLIRSDRPSAVVSGHGLSDVSVEIQSHESQQPTLPEPLAEIRDEFRVARGTALAYELKQGETVQIIDVEGRQCSDFMAMNAEQLDQGRERYIDSAVSRTMTRSAYPIPGLFDKFFDQDMMPLLAVSQDTVGRHDTFALACTARGYEERGFPGHLNCSDNISAAYEPWSIARRRAWPAINFFFNSWIHPSDNRIQADEAWSRAGDYVAMQALRDLVCVSTACPDDVDPINGWNPTDIHVRIYRSDNPLPRAVAYRPTTESESVMTRQSAFHPRTSELTSQFGVARDVWAPAQFDATGALEEYWACRNAATVQDMSSLRKLDIAGPDAERLLQQVVSRDVARIAVNRGVYALILDDQGTVVDDGTLFRMAPDLFRWCCGSDDSALTLKAMADALSLRVWIRDVSTSLANVAVQGPASRDILNGMLFTQPTQPKFANLKWFGYCVARVHDRNGMPLMVTRSGYTGELGYEVFCDQRDALSVWDAIGAAGEQHGLKPMGGDALEILRIEAGLMAAGAEFDHQCDADESGLGFAVDLKKPEFTGRAAIERNRQAPRRKLVGLLLDGEEVPLHGDQLYIDRRAVGVVTSATKSPQLGKVIAMARLAVEAFDSVAAGDARIEIGKLDGHRKRLPCEVTTVPFIDAERRKPRG